MAPLDSILNAMDKPPTVGNKERTIMKKQKEMQEKHVAKEKDRLKRFREKLEVEINEFIQNSQKQNHKFQPMDKVCRSITHDVADVAGLTAFSFGEEEIDRYVMIFKKEFAPSDEELLAYRKGEVWNPEKAKEAARLKELAKIAEKEDLDRQANSTVITPLYKEKNDKRLGREAAKDAEKIIMPNRQFGFVPSENKRDQRSIEQTLSDIRAKKKLKTSQENQEDIQKTL